MVSQFNHIADNSVNLSSPQSSSSSSILNTSEFERGLGPNLGRRRRARRQSGSQSSYPLSIGSPPVDAPAHAEFKPHIPIPTPFEYVDEDTDDFRDPFDFDQAWAAPLPKSPEHLAIVESPKPFDPYESSLDPCLLSPTSSSSASSGSSGMFSILTPNTPHTPYLPYLPEHDQEYDEFRYRLDLGAESPYLGSAYADVFPTKVVAEVSGLGPCESQHSFPKKGSRESTSTESGASEGGESPTDYSMHCGICLRKAVSPCRTRCCETLFCLIHITDWLRSKESSGLCPSCDRLCILPPMPSDKPSSHSRPSSSSSASSTSSSSTAYSSHTTTRTNTGNSSSSTLTWTSTDETGGVEDVWDVKASWKKNGGGSLDLVKMAKDVMGESMKLVTLSRGDDVSSVRREQRRQPGSPGSKAPQRSGSRGGFGGFDAMGSMAEEADFEIGEVGVGKRMVSIVGLVLVLFVLLR